MNAASIGYDWGSDSRAIESDHDSDLHDKDMPWVIYKDGSYRACFDTFERACRHAEKMKWLGACTIRDAFAEPATLGPMFGAGYEAGYAKAVEDAATIAHQFAAPAGHDLATFIRFRTSVAEAIRKLCISSTGSAK